MSLRKNLLEISVLTGLILWGAISLFQGAGLSLFVSGQHQMRDELFIEVLYCSVIIISFVGLFRARVAAYMSILIATFLLITVFMTDGFAHGLIASEPLMWAIFWRPFLAGFLLFLLPPIGPVGRLTRSKSKKFVGHSATD